MNGLQDVVVDGIDHRDAPDFCDAFISSASLNGVPLSDAELDALNEDRSFVHEQVERSLY